MSAAWTLWIKHMRRFARSPVEIMATLFLPALLVGLFGTGMAAAVGPGWAFGPGYVSYMAPGAAALAVLSAAVLGGATLLQERLTGTLKPYLVTPAPRYAILVGTLAAASTKAVLQAAVVLALAAAAGARFTVRPTDLAAAALGLAAFALGFGGLAAWFASRLSSMAAYHSVIMVFNVPLLFVSSALYPLDRLPVWLRLAGLANPTSYLVELLRPALVGTPPTLSPGVALGVLAAFCAAGLAAGVRGARAWATPG